MSESGIGCKDNENNDKLYVFRGLFFMTSTKSLALRHTRKEAYSLILPTSSSGLKSSILEKANHFFPKSLMEAPT